MHRILLIVYDRNDAGEVIEKDGKKTTKSIPVPTPVRLGYHHADEPMIVLGFVPKIFVSDIVALDLQVEL